MINIPNFNSHSLEDIKLFIINTPLVELKKMATATRERMFGTTIQMCSIINAKSGSCKEDCKFCAQSTHYAANIPRYPLLKPEKILKEAISASANGVVNFGIVTSGATVTNKEFSTICKTIRMITESAPVKVCASLGKLSAEKLGLLKDSGLSRYHHNFETSESYFHKICQTHTWQERLETIKSVQKVDLELCAGALFGLGESWDDRINLLQTLHSLNIKSIPINFLTPIHGTPLENRLTLTCEESLRIIALYRLFLIDSTIRVCGGRSVVFTNEQRSEIYAAGANAIMTGNYLTTYGITPLIDKRSIIEMGLTLKT